ncbi:uncharacterized protein LOC119082911 [Bradysia coprophila]|uniref:uncharacterized protein LOC119082911 n=1 Tax=Bradysia coprophila TaxID=38358 RepID=UPI00187DD48E|nr:uncharacterized protein LOC119082911 [Bradysia coprophila]
MALSKLTFGKLLELVLTITCLGLHYNSMEQSDMHTILITAGTFVGYTIILVGLFAGYVMNTPINKRIDIFFSLIGAALFIAAGVMVIQHWENGFKTDTRKLALTKGSLAIINGVLFFLDTILTFRD